MKTNPVVLAEFSVIMVEGVDVLVHVLVVTLVVVVDLVPTKVVGKTRKEHKKKDLAMDVVGIAVLFVADEEVVLVVRDLVLAKGLMER